MPSKAKARESNNYKNKRQIHRNIKFSCNDKERRREEGKGNCSFKIYNQVDYSFIHKKEVEML